MKTNTFTVKKQTGKVVKPTIIVTSVSSSLATYKDTDFYQVLGHNDYVQDNGSK